jgi:hypothetical protein
VRGHESGPSIARPIPQWGCFRYATSRRAADHKATSRTLGPTSLLSTAGRQGPAVTRARVGFRKTRERSIGSQSRNDRTECFAELEIPAQRHPGTAKPMVSNTAARRFDSLVPRSPPCAHMAGRCGLIGPTAGSQRISRRDRVAVALAGEEMLVFVAAPPRVPSIAHRHDFVRRVGDVDVRCSLTVSNVGPPLLDPGHALGA